jgi:TetR/AcrR family transcriptional regulator
MAATATGSSSRILQTALALFSSKGYDATSVREICEAAGITKPTLYHFFGSKDGVYRALVQGALDDFQRNVEQGVQPPGSTLERLQRVARGYFDSANRQRELVRFIFALVHNPSNAAPPTDFPKFYDGVVQIVAGVVEEGVARGELAPGSIEVRLLVLMGALGEAVCGNLIVGRPDLTPELADTLVETVVGGWREGRQG